MWPGVSGSPNHDYVFVWNICVCALRISALINIIVLLAYRGVGDVNGYIWWEIKGTIKALAQEFTLLLLHTYLGVHKTKW